LKCNGCAGAENADNEFSDVEPDADSGSEYVPSDDDDSHGSSEYSEPNNSVCTYVYLLNVS